jgi:Fur family zinc uptake transcriptional regulator/Fur family ferric uptake transcriptional regulator
MITSQFYIDILKNNGYKITPQRKEILKALSEDKMQTVEEIHKQILINQPNVSLDTIYRNIKLLQQLKVLVESSFGDGKTRFKLALGHSHNHHLICLKCGCSEKLDFCPMEMYKDRIENKKFLITNHNFEIFGYCDNCLVKTI